MSDASGAYETKANELVSKYLSKAKESAAPYGDAPSGAAPDAGAAGERSVVVCPCPQPGQNKRCFGPTCMLGSKPSITSVTPQLGI